MGVRARATGTRKTQPAAENKLGGFKNFTISASSDPRIVLAAAFFPPRFPRAQQLYHSVLHAISPWLSFPRCVSCYLVYFIIIPSRQLATWPDPAPPLDAQSLYFIPIVNSPPVHAHLARFFRSRYVLVLCPARTDLMTPTSTPFSLLPLLIDINTSNN